jgi:hypothetical protein
MRFATMASAPMVRVSQNRFMENYGAAIVSCWTQAQIQNQTTGNQATHCLLATGPRLIEQGNQILYPSVCEFLQKVGSGKEKYDGAIAPKEIPDIIKERKISTKALLDSFDRTAAEQSEDQVGEMRQLAELLDIRVKSLAQTAERLAAGLGDDHPQVVTMRLTATASSQIKDALDTTAIRQARLPRVKAHEWMVHGQVVDEAGAPLEGLRVRVYDKDRRYDDLLGDTETDEYGDFAVVYHERDFSEAGEALPELYIMVEDQQGNELYSSRDSVRAAAGRVERFEIILERQML